MKHTTAQERQGTHQPATDERETGVNPESDQCSLHSSAAISGDAEEDNAIHYRGKAHGDCSYEEGLCWVVQNLQCLLGEAHYLCQLHSTEEGKEHHIQPPAGNRILALYCWRRAPVDLPLCEESQKED